MNVYDIIYRKRNGGTLSAGELRYMVDGYTREEIPDYQMSAFLMAAFIRGLDDGEIAAFTEAMTRSGDVLDLSEIDGVKVDKHSTGGVGDGTSLVVAPLAAAAGLVVPMMSGRGLGHTGGTLDKLESIPGFNVQLSEEQYRQQLARIGVAMIGQTGRVAPADKKIYALRDVTATVDCIGLISASIMSKKLSEGCDALVLDVKTGSGAFMRRIDDARLLAKTMVAIGKRCGKRITAVITDMDQPLGAAVGNALEVRQAVETLRGGGPEDFVELCLELTARMLVIGGRAAGTAAAKDTLRACIRSGAALEKFRQIVEAQGGDPCVVDAPDNVLPAAAQSLEIRARSAGYVVSIDTTAIGRAGVLIGAGRARKEDAIDPGAGFLVRKKKGDRVEQGETLVTVLHGGGVGLEEAVRMVEQAYGINDKNIERTPLLYDEINEELDV